MVVVVVGGDNRSPTRSRRTFGRRFSNSCEDVHMIDVVVAGCGKGCCHEM